MSPVSNALIGSVGITNAFLYLGIIFLVIICLAAFLFQPCPADFVPDGYVPPATSANAVGEGKNWRGMLADRRFYVMFFLLLCGAFSGMMIISQASPVAQVMVGMDAAAAAAIVSLISVFNSGGRLICGFISDKLGRLNTLTVMLVVSVAGLALLYASGSGSVPLFCVGVCMIGLSFGAFMAIFPAFTVDQFGAKYNTLNYPIMMLGFALSSFLGPVMMSSLYESMGAYRPAFLVALGIVILGLILTFVFRAITRRKADA